jgi:hypothetical protein
MNFKSLLRAGPIILFCATLSTGLIANAASPDATPAASATTKHKVSLDSIKAARLTRLKKQVELTPDQEAKAKPIIDKYVDDRHTDTGAAKEADGSAGRNRRKIKGRASG